MLIYEYIWGTRVDSMRECQDTSKHGSIPAVGVGIEVLEAFVQAVSIPLGLDGEWWKVEPRANFYPWLSMIQR